MSSLERPIHPFVQQDIEGEWTLSPRRHAVVGRHGRSSRGRAPLPLARARTQPARPAAALCQLPGARGNPRAAAAETGRLGFVPFADSTNPIRKGRTSVPLYPVSPDAPAGARALPPQELAGWLVATLDARLRLSGDEQLHALVTRESSSRTAGHTAISSSCWPRRSIAASAAASHLPRKPWSGPISRACPTTARPTWPMGRRRQSSSGFGRLGPAAAEVIPDILESKPSRLRLLSHVILGPRPASSKLRCIASVSGYAKRDRVMQGHRTDRSTRVPLFAGEKVELVEGFRPYLDNRGAGYDSSGCRLLRRNHGMP